MMRMAYFGLPSATNEGESLADVHAALQSQLVADFGGFSAFHGLGGWCDPVTGKIHVEPGIGYHVAMAPSEENRAKLESIALFFGHMAEQLSVMVTHADGEVIFRDVATVRARASVNA